LQTCLTATGTHVPHGITQCWLPCGRGEIPAFAPYSVDMTNTITPPRLSHYQLLIKQRINKNMDNRLQTG